MTVRDETDTTARAHTYARAVAARVRGVAAERQVRGVELAGVLGISQMAVSRRMTGKIPWAVDELAALALHLGVTVRALLPDERVVGAQRAPSLVAGAGFEPATSGSPARAFIPRQRTTHQQRHARRAAA